MYTIKVSYSLGPDQVLTLKLFVKVISRLHVDTSKGIVNLKLAADYILNQEGQEEHSCKVWSKFDEWYQESCHLKAIC